jgi:osmotically-inducible protein OsmY
MNKLNHLLILTLLVFSAVACQNPSKTTVSAPNPNQPPEVPNAQTTQAAREDAQSEVRRNQLNADIRAREQRNNAGGGGTTRTAGDLASEVRSKLEANLPDAQLTVNTVKEGTVVVSGTVNNQEQLAKIQPAAKEIKGVRDVVVRVIVAPPRG